MQFLSRAGSFSGVVRPDLILLDLNLPGMDGREVLKRIKGDHDLRQIPVVILSTSEADMDILKSYAMGANCYVVKPVDFENFSQVISEIEQFWFSVVKLPKRELLAKYIPSAGTRGPLSGIKIEPLESVHVLHVEDSDADADLVLESLNGLREPRFTCHRSVRLSDALEYLKSHSVDIVLLDLSLPDSHGFETVVSFLGQAGNMR